MWNLIIIIICLFGPNFWCWSKHKKVVFKTFCSWGSETLSNFHWTPCICVEETKLIIEDPRFLLETFRFSLETLRLSLEIPALHPNPRFSFETFRFSFKTLQIHIKDPQNFHKRLKLLIFIGDLKIFIEDPKIFIGEFLSPQFLFSSPNFGSPINFAGCPRQIWGSRYKSELVSLSNDNLLVSLENLGPPMKIWKSQRKYGVSNGKFGVSNEIWGVLWKDLGLRWKDLGIPNSTFIENMFRSGLTLVSSWDC